MNYRVKVTSEGAGERTHVYLVDDKTESIVAEIPCTYARIEIPAVGSAECILSVALPRVDFEVPVGEDVAQALTTLITLKNPSDSIDR